MAALKKIFSILFCIVILSQAQAVEPSTKTDVQVKNGGNWVKQLMVCGVESSQTGKGFWLIIRSVSG